MDAGTDLSCLICSLCLVSTIKAGIIWCLGQHHGVPSQSRLTVNHVQLGPCQAETWHHHRTKSPSHLTFSTWVPATKAQSTGRNSPHSCKWATSGEKTVALFHTFEHIPLPDLPSTAVPSTTDTAGDLLKSAFLPLALTTPWTTC